VVERHLEAREGEGAERGPFVGFRVLTDLMERVLGGHGRRERRREWNSAFGRVLSRHQPCTNQQAHPTHPTLRLTQIRATTNIRSSYSKFVVRSCSIYNLESTNYFIYNNDNNSNMNECSITSFPNFSRELWVYFSKFFFIYFEVVEVFILVNFNIC
jgi:hypothetical protein